MVMTRAMQTISADYKQTELGIIPEDWGVRRLDDIFSITAGRDLIKDSYSQISDDNHLFPIYSNSLENKGLYGYTKTPRHKENSITITARGSIGKANARYHKFDAIGRLLILEPIKELDCFFISEYLNNRVVFSIESTGVPQLTAPQASKYLVAYPDPEEQTAIATVLSGTDVLIEHLEKLISKKKAIKQGAMQQLLTGKKRLLEFSEEWEIKKLGEICEIKKGQLITDRSRIEGNIPVIAGGKVPAYFHNKANRNGKTITISASGASAGYVAYHTYPIFVSDCSSIEESKKYAIEFIYFLLKSKQEKIYKMQTGGAQPHIHPSDLTPINVSMPKKEEQTAIATVLSDMDAEIEKLEEKLDKYRQIKTGMMQQLLTGKIRLGKN